MYIGTLYFGELNNYLNIRKKPIFLLVFSQIVTFKRNKQCFYSFYNYYFSEFGATIIGSHVFKVNTVIDTPFELMDTNGCKYTSCPVEANKKQVYNYGLEIRKQFPAVSYISQCLSGIK